MAADYYRSKTWATWIAVVGGSLGLHRAYLHGLRDTLLWAHAPATLLGLVGVARMKTFGQDDPLSWALIPLLGVMIAQGMLCAIVIGLTTDERWDAKFNATHAARSTRWGPVLGVIAALMVGGAVLMGSVAFGVQKFFEWSLHAGR